MFQVGGIALGLMYMIPFFTVIMVLDKIPYLREILLWGFIAYMAFLFVALAWLTILDKFFD